MKKFLLALVLAQVCCATLQAQTFTVDTLLNNGNRNNRINLVFLAEGYTSSQQAQFITDVNAIMDKFFLTAPLSNYKSFFNVYAVHVVSTETGTKHPNTATDCSAANPTVPVSSPTTYFNATFDYGGTHRLLYSNSSSLVNGVLQANTPWYDKALIVVNTPYYGGSGGAYPMASTNTNSAEIMIHEFGHSFAGLGDEYGGSSCTGAEKPNVTQETSPNLIKWNAWINPGTAIPTPANTNCSNDGLYNGANYCNNGWYRPECDCKMRTLNTPFCEICKQEFIVKIMQYVNLIDSYTPANTATLTLTSGATQTFTAQVLNSLPNTMKTEWKVDNALVASNVGAYAMNTGNFSNGTHTVTVSAWDTTDMVRVVLPVFTTTWNINIGTGSGTTPTLAAFGPVCASASAFALNGGSPAGGVYSGTGVTNNTFNPSVAGAGIATITYTYNGQTATQTINVTAAPVLTGSSSATVCSGSSTSLSVGGASSYTWSPNTALNTSIGATVTTNPLTNVTYTVTGTSGGCSATKTIAVAVTALPNVTTSGNASVCNGSGTTLTASGATSYSWTPSTGLTVATGASVTATPTTNVTYSVTGTANGCSKSMPVVVTVNAVPQLTGTSTASVCAGSSTALSVSGATTYSWSPLTALNSSTGATVNASPPSNITYTVTGTQNGCSNTKTIAVTVNALPTLSVSPTQSVCAGSSATLQANGATTFAWSPSTGLNTTTGSSTVATPSSNITYTVTGTQNGCSNTAIVSVQIAPAPTVTATASSNNLCIGSSSTLTAGGSATGFTWSPSTALSSTVGNVVTATPTQSITYTLTGTGNGCTAASTVAVHVNALPTITTSGNASVCNGSSTNLSASGAITYAWAPATGLNATSGANVTALPTATTTYTITGSNGCSNTATLVVSVTTGVQLTGSSDQSICSATSTNLSVSGANSYSWSPSTGLNATTGGDVTASPTSSTTYTATGYAGSCNATKVIAVNVTASPTLIATNNVSLCNGFSVPLSVSGATSYSWSPVTGLSTTTGTSVSAHPNVTTTYTVTGTANGCSANKTIAVTVNAVPVLTATSNTSVCNGTSQPLTAGGATTYAWSPATGLNAATGANVVATPSQTTTYTVTGTSNGCNALKTVVLAVKATPSLSAVTTNPSCTVPYGAIDLTVQNTTNNAFAWSNGATTEDINALNAGAYGVTVTAPTGCTSTQLYALNTISPCTPPSGFTVQNLTSNTAFAKWHSVSCSFGYKLRYKQQNGYWIYISLTDTFKQFSGLNANTTYNYEVLSWCNAAHTDSSGYSATQSFFTTSGCGTPVGLSSSDITATSAKMQWTPVSGALSYKVRYMKISGGGWNEVIVPASQPYLQPTDLTPSSTYKYQLRSVCGPTSMSQYSVSKYFTTLSLRLEGQNEHAEMNVYPNPTEAQVTVEAAFDTEGAYRVDIVDMTGRTVRSMEDYTFNGNFAVPIDVQQFAAGVYFARVIKGDNVLTRKLIKQ